MAEDYSPAMALPEVAEADAMAVDVGLYRIKGSVKRGYFARPEIDFIEHDVPIVLVLRIDTGTVLPDGLVRAEIRPDGKRLLMQYQPVLIRKDVEPHG